MIRSFDELIQRAEKAGALKVAVAYAQDEDVLLSLKAAHARGLVKGYLIGDVEEIKKIGKEIGFDFADFELVDVKDKVEASEVAVRYVSSGKADMVMKGLVDTSIVLKAVLNKEWGLRTGNALSHVAVFDVPAYHKLIMLTDAAMMIAPNLEQKKQLIENSLVVAHALDIAKPNVGVICAKEKVTDAMQATLDAGALVDMYKNGEIKGCAVGGPFALDNAISKEAAVTKGIQDEMAGDVDVLLMPNIESGNVLYKALNFWANAASAGIIVGAKAPIILTSRADSDETKLNSIALAVLMGWRSKHNEL